MYMNKRNIGFLLWKYQTKQPGEVWTTERETEAKREYRFKQKIFLFDKLNEGFLKGLEKTRVEYFLENYTFEHLRNYSNEEIILCLMLYVKLEFHPYHEFSTYSWWTEEHNITQRMMINFLSKMTAYHWRKSNIRKFKSDKWENKQSIFESIMNSNYFRTPEEKMERVTNTFVFDRPDYTQDENKLSLFEEFNKTHFLKGEDVEKMKLLIQYFKYDNVDDLCDEEIIAMLMLSVKLDYGEAKYSKYTYWLDKHNITEEVFINFLVKLNLFYLEHKYS